MIRLLLPAVSVSWVLGAAGPAGGEERRLPWREEKRAIHAFFGEEVEDQFGYEAADAGDADGDGVHDVVVGAPFQAGGGRFAGRVYLFSGKTGAELRRWSGEEGEMLGWSVAGAGDVNGDGRADVVVGAPDQRFGPGKVYVYSGFDGKTLLTLTGEKELDWFGDEVETAGDRDGDGHADLIVGASRHDGAGEDAGRAYVFSGRTGDLLHVFDGEGEGDRFGSAVAGDVRGEHRLLVVGAPGAGPADHGRAYVYRGAEAELAFVVDAGEAAKALASHFVSIVGDVDSDGVPDVYVSDWRDEHMGAQSGAFFVYSGKDGSLLLEKHGHPGEGFGIGNARAGDVDGDGRDDLVVGAWTCSDLGRSAGRVYLFAAREGKRLDRWTGDVRGATLGFDATGLGDVDGDGWRDFLVSAAYMDGKRGAVYVLSGER